MTEKAIWIVQDFDDERERNENIREAVYALEREYGAEAVRQQIELVFENDPAFDFSDLG